MSDRQNLVTISYHNDDETGLNYIGEPDGYFNEKELEEYLIRFGSKGIDNLVLHLTNLIIQVKKVQENKREKIIASANQGK